MCQYSLTGAFVVGLFALEYSRRRHHEVGMARRHPVASTSALSSSNTLLRKAFSVPCLISPVSLAQFVSFIATTIVRLLRGKTRRPVCFSFWMKIESCSLPLSTLVWPTFCQPFPGQCSVLEPTGKEPFYAWFCQYCEPFSVFFWDQRRSVLIFLISLSSLRHTTHLLPMDDGFDGSEQRCIDSGRTWRKSYIYIGHWLLLVLWPSLQSGQRSVYMYV